MKIYTRTGDDGTTGLHGGTRLSKCAARVEAYGDLDELNAALGAVLSLPGQPPFIRTVLSALQTELFEVGADLATPLDSPQRRKVSPVGAGEIAQLEQWIDEATARLPEQKTFILPGGCECAARLHAARTICRRAERMLVRLIDAERPGAVRSEVLAWVNRVSDLLFVLARLANQEAGIPDVPWIPRARAQDA